MVGKCGDAVSLRHVHGKAGLHGARGAFAFVGLVVVAPHQFEQHAFAQGFLANDGAVEVEVLVERGEDADAAREAVGARFVHAQFFRQFVGVADVGEFVEQGVKVGAVDGVFFEDAGDGFGGAGAQDDARPRALAAVGRDVRFDDGAGVVARFFDGGFADFTFGEVARGDVGAADGERAQDLRFAARAEDDFGGAAADVDDEAAVGEVVVFADAEVDERRFFAAADDFYRFAQRGFARGEEGVAVFGDAQGIGGDRAEVVFGDVGDELSHLGKRFDAARDGFCA